MGCLWRTRSLRHLCSSGCRGRGLGRWCRRHMTKRKKQKHCEGTSVLRRQLISLNCLPWGTRRWCRRHMTKRKKQKQSEGASVLRRQLISLNCLPWGSRRWCRRHMTKRKKQIHCEGTSVLRRQLISPNSLPCCPRRRATTTRRRRVGLPHTHAPRCGARAPTDSGHTSERPPSTEGQSLAQTDTRSSRGGVPRTRDQTAAVRWWRRAASSGT